jgi:hypothetical protein
MNRKRISTLALMIAIGLVVASSGCEKDSKTERGQLQVVNSSSYTIGYLYVSPSSSPDWGPDQLGSYVIDPGESFIVYGIEAGFYDIMAQDLDHNELASTYSEYIDSDGLVWTLYD